MVRSVGARITQGSVGQTGFSGVRSCQRWGNRGDTLARSKSLRQQNVGTYQGHLAHVDFPADLRGLLYSLHSATGVVVIGDEVIGQVRPTFFVHFCRHEDGHDDEASQVHR